MPPRRHPLYLTILLFCWLTACNGRPARPLPRQTVNTPLRPTPTLTPTAQAAATATLTAVAPVEDEVVVGETAVVPLPTVLLPSTSTITPSPTPLPILVNGLPTSAFVVLPEAVLTHSRQIFARGQELGRDPHVFSKVGDSVVLTTHFLIKFDTGLYELGEYAYLQRVIDYFAESYGRYGVAIHVGLHAYAILDPAWASPKWCQANESMLACEIRLNNPSILIIRVGSNDSFGAEAFDEAMREVVQQTIDSGVIPIIATKADRFEGEDDHNNEILRQITADYQVPLWDFDRIADTLPNHGLSPDGIHLTISETNDYTQPQTFERGYPISDLTALFVLNTLLEEVIELEN